MGPSSGDRAYSLRTRAAGRGGAVPPERLAICFSPWRRHPRTSGPGAPTTLAPWRACAPSSAIRPPRRRCATRLRRLGGVDHGLFVAEAEGGGDLCGVVDVHERVVLEEDPFAELIALVVTGDARGEGIGSALVAEAVRWARARDLPKLWVRVSLWREATPSFYESLGFHLYKEQRVFELTL